MSESGSSSVSRWFRRITVGAARPQPPAEPAEPISGCRERQKVEVTGRITALEAHRPEERCWLQAELADASGTLQLIWMGRRAIPGIEVGSRLRVEGRVANVGGRPTVFNPRYELLPTT